MKLEDFLTKEYGYNVQVRKDIQTYLDQWKSWYKGNVRSFHNYFIYNGQVSRFSLFGDVSSLKAGFIDNIQF